MALVKHCLVILLLMASSAVQGQDSTVKRLKADAVKTIKKEADTAARIWRRGGLYNLQIAQGSLRNWAAGGDDFSLTITSVLNLFAFYTKGRRSWDNTLDVNFGYVNTTSLGARKNDDRLDILSKYGYSLDSAWNLSGLVNFRSQLFKGYTYGQEDRTLASAFLSPAYVLTSVGIDFKPAVGFSLYMSPVTARLILVQNDSLAAKGLYGVQPGENSRWEFGAFLTANFLKEINKVVSYKGRLDLFSNYRNKPENVDLFLSNVFSARLSRIFTATWNLDLIYDDDVRLFGKENNLPALQVKSLVGVGVQVKF